MNQTVSERRHSTGSHKKTKVKVTASPLGSAPWVEFTMRADFPDAGGQQVGDELKFDKGAGAFELTIALRDDTDLGLAFFADAGDSIWAAVGTGKPLQGGFANGTITPVSISDKKLVVTNDNSVAQTLNFILRFTGTAMPGGCPPYVLDPLIINGGGGGGSSLSDR